jgi:hypothetical protein
MTGPETGWRVAPPRHPYSVLLPVGFTVPPLLPGARWALTPPFHPYLLKEGGLLSVALSLGSPPPDVIRHRVSVEPGLSSRHRLSALMTRGCPANWRPGDSVFIGKTPQQIGRPLIGSVNQSPIGLQNGLRTSRSASSRVMPTSSNMASLNVSMSSDI